MSLSQAIVVEYYTSCRDADIITVLAIKNILELHTVYFQFEDL